MVSNVSSVGGIAGGATQGASDASTRPWLCEERENGPMVTKVSTLALDSGTSAYKRPSRSSDLLVQIRPILNLATLKHGEEGNNHVFRIVLDYLEATPIDALSDNRIVHAVYNPPVLGLQWVGKRAHRGR